jgi:transcription elongation GreA/GreB family factor
MSGGTKPPRAGIGHLVTLLIEGGGGKRVLLADAKCVDVLSRVTGHPEAIVATRSPLGAAILNRSCEDRCEYQEGNCVKVVQIVGIDPGPVL